MTADWNTQAACRTADPALFDTCCAAKTVPPEAATLCAACPVRQQCYDLAMSTELGTAPTYRFGIFGGTSPDQRAKAWPKWATAHGISGNPQRSGLAPCGTPAAYRRHLRKGEPIDVTCAADNRRRHAARAARQQPPQCGTRRGYQKHRRDGEPACEACKAANAAADRRLATTGSTKGGAPIPPLKPRGGGKPKPIDHGTYRGAKQHEYRQQEMCQPCRDAYNAYRRSLVAERRAAKEAAA